MIHITGQQAGTSEHAARAASAFFNTDGMQPVRAHGDDHGDTRAYAAHLARIIDAETKLLRDALCEIAAIGDAGIIERRETGQPTWSITDAVKTIARAALA